MYSIFPKHNKNMYLTTVELFSCVQHLYQLVRRYRLIIILHFGLTEMVLNYNDRDHSNI